MSYNELTEGQLHAHLEERDFEDPLSKGKIFEIHSSESSMEA